MELNGKFSIGDFVKIIKSGSGVKDTEIGICSYITHLGEYTYGGRPGAKLAVIKNLTYDNWIGVDSFELVERNTKSYNNLNAIEQKKFLKIILGQLFSIPNAYKYYSDLIEKLDNQKIQHGTV